MAWIVFFIYVIVSSFSFIQFKEIKVKYFVLLIFSISLILTAGLRTPGLDYQNYVDIYLGQTTKSIEPAIDYISLALKSIFNHPISLFIVFAILGVGLKIIAITQLTRLWFLSIALYVSFYFLYHEMIQIRAGVVSGFLLLCIKPLYKKDYKTFLLFVFLGSLFHVSALTILPLWFLNGKKHNSHLYVFIVVISYVLSLIGISVTNFVSYIPIEQIQVLYAGYIYSTSKGIHSQELNIFSVIQITRILISFLLLLYIEIISEKNKYAKLLIKIYILSVSSYVLFSDLPILAVRISQLLGVVEIILIPLAIYAFKSRSLTVSKFFPILVGGLYLFILIFHRQLL